MDKNKATEVKVVFVGTLDFVIKYLIEAREKRRNIFINYEGHKLYSADISVNRAYLEVCGCTKEEFDKKIAQRKARKIERCKEAQAIELNF